jgi:hypothetical protein
MTSRYSYYSKIVGVKLFLLKNLEMLWNLSFRSYDCKIACCVCHDNGLWCLTPLSTIFHKHDVHVISIYSQEMHG